MFINYHRCSYCNTFLNRHSVFCPNQYCGRRQLDPIIPMMPSNPWNDIPRPFQPYEIPTPWMQPSCPPVTNPIQIYRQPKPQEEKVNPLDEIDCRRISF